CESGWSGNRCHVKEKPSLTTLHPTLEATQLDPVYAGIGIGLVLLLAGVAVCFLALCKNKCGFIKADPMKYGMMDNPSFDWRAEVSAQRCPINHRQSHFGLLICTKFIFPPFCPTLIQ
ncbi:hypothetical protein AMECASPLE_028686, partial [Ameca splendens]